MNNDRFVVGMNPERLRQAAFGALSCIQDQQEEQVLGLTVALLALCEGARIDVRSLLESTERLMRDLDGPFSAQVRAIREYAKGELV